MSWHKSKHRKLLRKVLSGSFPGSLTLQSDLFWKGTFASLENVIIIQLDESDGSKVSNLGTSA